MLNEKITLLINEIKRLKDEIREKEKLLAKYLEEENENESPASCKYSKELSTEEITRYSRQMLVTDIGLSGQIKLKNSKVLVVGAGGLGCPAAVYLACAGVGEITIIDYDDVELSNLHRQILHTEDDIGFSKVESVYNKLHRINKSIKIIPIKQHLDSQSISNLLNANNYNVLIDGSDNVATRYLLNDACVINGIPLVSGSALQMEAQLTVFNYKGGPCYRCLFPVPPPPETVTSCGDGGVVGAVPGLIGVLQAFQTIKILLESTGILTERYLLFDGSNSMFRNVKLRPRDLKCAICGDNKVVPELIDYEEFCGSSAHDKVMNINILDGSENIDPRELPKELGNAMVLDVRPRQEFEISRLPHTINVPFDNIQKPEGLDMIRSLLKETVPENKVYVICRRGNNSQRAIKHLKEKLSDLPVHFVNVKGGLHAFSKYVDCDFPIF